MQTVTCPIASIEALGGGVRRVILELPEPVDFHAGQYLEIHLPAKTCPFSIASAPSRKDQLELHVRPTPDSDDSIQIEALLDSESELTIDIPQGKCFVTEAPAGPLYLIAASTGVTQMKSIIEHLLPRGLDHPVYLYWGVLSRQDLYLSDLCREWEAADSHFHFIPVVSGEVDDSWQGRRGLVGQAALEDITSAADISVIVSGSPAMVYATLDAFVARGMPQENMRSDVFSYAPRK